LLVKDAHVVYANALMQDGRAQDAVSLLEQDRRPPRVDVEWNLGRAYQAAGEADAAAAELKKLAASTSVPAMSTQERRARADLLAKGRRFSDAVTEYR